MRGQDDERYLIATQGPRCDAWIGARDAGRGAVTCRVAVAQDADIVDAQAELIESALVDGEGDDDWIVGGGGDVVEVIVVDKDVDATAEQLVIAGRPRER